MKKALILFPHGIGDVIMATPCLRDLHSAGYTVDMMVRDSVIDSCLLNKCPYIGTLYSIKVDGKGIRGPAFKNYSLPAFDLIKNSYDWSGVVLLNGGPSRIKQIAKELKLRPKSWNLEVFISKKAHITAWQYLKDNKICDFVFVHTVPVHSGHIWESAEFVKKAFPKLSVVDTRYLKTWKDINVTFALAYAAKHRVLSCSVMVHACDAMGCTIDAVNYGTLNNPCYPLRKNVILKDFIKGKAL